MLNVTTMEKNFTTQNPSAVMTPEGIFINLYAGALQNLQSTWMNTGENGEINREAFAIQIRFIQALIPDPELRKQIDREIEAIEASFRPNTDQYKYRQVHAGLAVVPHLVKFICDTYDLINEDVIGPGTRIHFKREHGVDIPDMPAEDDVNGP